MISYHTYKLIHFIGIFMALLSIGALVMHRITSGSTPPTWRKPVMISHGLGLFLVLLGGFGMLARMGLVSGLPGWIHAKLAIWVLLGVVVVVMRLRPQLAKATWWVSLTLAGLAAYIAMTKPF